MKEKFMEVSSNVDDMFTKDENIILRAFIEVSLYDLDIILNSENSGMSRQTLKYIKDRKEQLNVLVTKIEKLTI